MVVKTEVAKHSWTLSREFSSLFVCFQSECSWTCVSSTHGSGARGCVMASVGTADVPAARPRRCAERSFHWHPHGLGDARWRQEQTSGQRHPVGRGQHHRYHRTQVAGYGRLGTARNRQVAGRDS